ncbi:MAG: Mur ligase family protein, partial [Candidatus Buchananbacteria bacterium]
MKNNFQKYFAAVQYLESLNRLAQDDYFTKKQGRKIFLKRLEYFLKLIGNPQKDLKYIHIGGTSGKGSVAAMIHSILTAAGYNAGLFTSPFCTTSIEKIKVGNLLISPDELAEIVESLKPAIDLCCQKSPYGRPSYFEIFTAIALVYFKQKKCDYAILEVGLGGRYDATNVIPPAKITVINLVDYDHTDVLGKTLKKITTEKAAIIKPKTIFFTPQQNRRVLKILKTACRKNQAEFNLITKADYQYQTNLPGRHQKANAAIAAAVGQKLGIKDSVIKRGLQKVKLPCRLEIVAKNPLVILAGAHNQSKIKTTVEFIKNLAPSGAEGSGAEGSGAEGSGAEGSGAEGSGAEGLTYRKLYLIIALTNDRNPQKIFGEIKLLADEIFVTRFQTNAKRSYPPKKLAKKLATEKPVKIFLDAKMAYDQALKLATKKDLILITGSLYLAGELRQIWRP